MRNCGGGAWYQRFSYFHYVWQHEINVNSWSTTLWTPSTTWRRRPGTRGGNQDISLQLFFFLFFWNNKWRYENSTGSMAYLLYLFIYLVSIYLVFLFDENSKCLYIWSPHYYTLSFHVCENWCSDYLIG